MPNQDGRNMIVTGANTGIGYKTALALYVAGANVTLACRDQDKAEQALVKTPRRHLRRNQDHLAQIPVRLGFQMLHT